MRSSFNLEIPVTGKITACGQTELPPGISAYCAATPEFDVELLRSCFGLILPCIFCQICKMLGANVVHQRAGLVSLGMVIDESAFFLYSLGFFIAVIVTAPDAGAGKFLKAAP